MDQDIVNKIWDDAIWWIGVMDISEKYMPMPTGLLEVRLEYGYALDADEDLIMRPGNETQCFFDLLILASMGAL